MNKHSAGGDSGLANMRSRKNNGARAGAWAKTPWGENSKNTCAHANVRDASLIQAMNERSDYDLYSPCNDGYPHTAPVGSLLPNNFGLYDMLGNVSEWTANIEISKNEGATFFGAYCHEATYREYYGGNWDNPAAALSYRDVSASKSLERYNIIGFRLIRTEGPEPQHANTKLCP